jgi:hypothetical protein
LCQKEEVVLHRRQNAGTSKTFGLMFNILAFPFEQRRLFF